MALRRIVQLAAVLVVTAAGLCVGQPLMNGNPQTEPLPKEASAFTQALADSAGVLLLAAGEAARTGSSDLALCYLSGTASLDSRLLSVDLAALEDGTGLWKALADLPRERWAEPPPAPGTSPNAPILRVGGDISPPRKLKTVTPQYTASAREARVQGVVILEVVIGTAGKVERTRVLKGLPLGLSAQAMLAMCQWEFEPAHRGGEPASVYYTLTLAFRLDSDPPPTP